MKFFKIDKNKNLLIIYKELFLVDTTLYDSKLNNFLTRQVNIDIIELSKILTSLKKETIDLIMPYLIEILSEFYKKSFINQKYHILSIEPPVEKKYFEKIYEPIYKILKDKENELENLRNSHYNLTKIKNIIGNLDVINSLPEYFTKIRSDIANAIRNLSVDSWNEKEDVDLALELINYALEFNVNKQTKNKFLSDKKDLKNIKNHIKNLQLQLLRELNIQGIENLTADELNKELLNGATFRRFKYVISVIFVTYLKQSPIIFIRTKENYLVKGLPYALKTLFFGWWGVPHGPIYSIGYLFSYLFGGENLTKEIKELLKKVEK